MYEPISEIDLKQKEYLSSIANKQISIFKDFNLKQILYNDTFYCLNATWKFIFRDIMKSLLFKTYFLDCDIRGQDILLLYSKTYRKDHDGYWEEIKKDIPEHDSITIKTRKISKLNLKSVPQKMICFFQCLKELKDINCFKDRCFLSIRLVDRKMALDEIESLGVSPKLVMCFFDSSRYESVLMQYFKKKGAITVTNQHGLCIFQSYEYDRMNQSQILNFGCDYYFARGQKQKEQFVLAGFEPNRIKVVGFIGLTNNEIPNPKTNCIGVYLDCPTLPMSKINNERMIEYARSISTELKMKFLIKCHPLDSVEYYQRIVDDNCLGVFGKDTSIDNTFHNVDICMTHASATYADVYRYGLRCLKMNSEVSYPIAVEDDEFNTLDDALLIISQWNSLCFPEKKKYIQSVREKYASSWKEGNINTELQRILGRIENENSSFNTN